MHSKHAYRAYTSLRAKATIHPTPTRRDRWLYTCTGALRPGQTLDRAVVDAFDRGGSGSRSAAAGCRTPMRAPARLRGRRPGLSVAGAVVRRVQCSACRCRVRFGAGDRARAVLSGEADAVRRNRGAACSDRRALRHESHGPHGDHGRSWTAPAKAPCDRVESGGPALQKADPPHRGSDHRRMVTQHRQPDRARRTPARRTRRHRPIRVHRGCRNGASPGRSRPARRSGR
jgi:hypothetical protein